MFVRPVHSPLAGCDSDSTSAGETEPSLPEASGEGSPCLDLSGTWTSTTYEALSVNLDGTHSTLADLEMTLEITQDEDCHFQALNTWSNGTLGGSEHIAGVVHNTGETISMVEVSEHPEGGTSARIHATWEDGHIAFEYAGHSADGERVVVFSTFLSREEKPR